MGVGARARDEFGMTRGHRPALPSDGIKTLFLIYTLRGEKLPAYPQMNLASKSLDLLAAIETLPYERPRLAATAKISGDGFAAMLDRAIERSHAAPDFKLIQHPPAQGAPAQGNDEHS
jgi:hypothetical protein